MAQQVVVAVLKKQILDKQKALTTAIAKRDEMAKKRDVDMKKADDDYKAASKKWEADVIEAALKAKLNKDNSSVSTRGYNEHETASITITLPTSKLPKRPERKEVKWEDYNVTVPVYYDSYHRSIYADAVLAHWKKALEMLEVLPAGTIEVQVKDFNFLTKF